MKWKIWFENELNIVQFCQIQKTKNRLNFFWKNLNSLKLNEIQSNWMNLHEMTWNLWKLNLITLHLMKI